MVYWWRNAEKYCLIIEISCKQCCKGFSTIMLIEAKTKASFDVDYSKIFDNLKIIDGNVVVNLPQKNVENENLHAKVTENWNYRQDNYLENKQAEFWRRFQYKWTNYCKSVCFWDDFIVVSACLKFFQQWLIQWVWFIDICRFFYVNFCIFFVQPEILSNFKWIF